MYPYFYPVVGTVSPCYYCTMGNRSLMNPVEPVKTKSMMRGTNKFEEDRTDKVSATPMQQMPGMGQQMPGMMDMSKMDMEKIKEDTQEIVGMFEQHHNFTKECA